MRPTTRALRPLFIAMLAGLLLMAGTRPAGAVPVFSRKYGTSCQTCHTIFPKLNPFGQAFRLNGYRMPKETEDQIKQQPVSLGAEAYKKIWPKAIMPGDLPGFAPFALNTKMATLYSSSIDPATGRTIVKNDFQFPQEVNIFTAGTLGDHFGFFGELTFGENTDGSVDTEIEHAQLHINSPFWREHLINFKIGKFAPDFEDGFQEMWLMTDNGVDTLFTFNPIGFNGGSGLSDGLAGISLPASVKGIEIYGVACHRLLYTVGVTNGLGPTDPAATTVDGNNRKDTYARVDWKFGGMGLDGDTAGKNLPAENWREKSFRVGLLGYWGDGTGINFMVTDPVTLTDFNQQDRHFERAGLFASWYYEDLNVFGVAMHGADRLLLLDMTTGSKVDETTHTFDAWFAQADYVIRPPFQVSLRYENVRPADGTVKPIEAWNANFSFLARANVKLMAEYRFDPRETQNYQIAGVLRFAY
jgi:hypothetical protein